MQNVMNGILMDIDRTRVRVYVYVCVCVLDYCVVSVEHE